MPIPCALFFIWNGLALASAFAAGQEDAPRPRLVVLISVDQLIAEQLDRLDPWLDGGLARVWREGWSFPAASLPYSETETGPGHATLATGCLPGHHGIVGNMFHSRALARAQYCVGDDRARTLTAAGARDQGGVSARWLERPTLGDRLRAENPATRVVSIAGKDRSAVLMGGRAATDVLWWDRFGAGFVTSDAFASELPAYARAWNADWPARAAGWTWAAEFPGDPVEVGCAKDERAGEKPLLGRTSFPYQLPVRGADEELEEHARELSNLVFATPLVDLFTLELARRACDALALGRGSAPDVLAIGLSGCDIVGHNHGPRAWETTDLLLKVDDGLGAFLAHLDATVGAGQWVLALTSDHGVLELPEALIEQGVGARRLGQSDIEALNALIDRALAESHPGHALEYTCDGEAITLDEPALIAAGLDPRLLRATIASAARQADWVADAYTLEDLAGARSDPWLALYHAAYFPTRCADVVVRRVPWSVMQLSVGTSHGSVYPYDRRIALAFLGLGAARRSYAPASSLDIAPTLLARLGLAQRDPAMDGKSWWPVLK